MMVPSPGPKRRATARRGLWLSLLWKSSSRRSRRKRTEQSRKMLSFLCVSATTASQEEVVFTFKSHTAWPALSRWRTPYLRGEQVVILIVHRRCTVSSQLFSFGTQCSRICHAVVEVFSKSFLGFYGGLTDAEAAEAERTPTHTRRRRRRRRGTQKSRMRLRKWAAELSP